MSDLLSLLGLGGAGIAAQNTGIAVAGNNVANANTVGYSRQRVDLSALEAAPLIGGVYSNDPVRLADSLLGSRIRIAGGALEMSRAFYDALSDAELRLVGAGDSIDQQIGALFSSLSQVAAAPTDDNVRSAVVDSARALVAGIRRRAAEIEAARDEADQRIASRAEQATQLATQLAKANEDVAVATDPVIADRRDEIARQLSELVGGQARVDSDGKMRFVLDGGAVLVDGTRAASLEATTDPATGYVQLDVVDGASRRDVTADITSGSVGGDLQVRDRVLAQTATQLDQLAFDLTQSFNAVHSVNTGKDGGTGRNMFTPLGAVTGAASAIELDPQLDADPDLLATAAPLGSPGDNRGAIALFGLSTQAAASGGTRTFTDAALDIAASLGVEASAAKDDVTRDEAMSDHLAGLRDSVSGVDIQEELTNLAKFEQVSSALAKFVATVDDLLGSLIQRL